jgi:hypothetical protein
VGDKAQQRIPPWENDPLSSFFVDAAFNERASSLNLPEVYSLLKQVDATFRCVAATVEKGDQLVLLLPCCLIMRVHSAFRSAVRLAMSGQAFEAMLPLRAAIEQAWYGLHIARDPRPFERSTTWLQRHHNLSAKQKCKEEFTVANVRNTHKTLDATTAEALQEMYEMTIDFGAHPNEMGLLASMRREQTKDGVTFKVGILNPEPLLITRTLQTAIEKAIGTLKVSQLIAPAQLKVEGLDLTIEQLIREGCRTFSASKA